MASDYRSLTKKKRTMRSVTASAAAGQPSTSVKSPTTDAWLDVKSSLFFREVKHCLGRKDIQCLENNCSSSPMGISASVFT